MNRKDIEIVATCPLFKGVPPETVKELLESIPYRIMNFEKESLVIIQGDEYESLRILLEGEVSAEIQDYNGRTIKIENLKAPDALATGILFADDNTLPVTLVAQSPVRLISIQKEAIIGIARKNREFLLNYFGDTGNKVVFLAEKIRLFKFKSLREKLTGYILSLAGKQNSTTVNLPYTREKLAELFGVARPSLSRVCSEMAEEGLFEMKGRTVRITDREKLREIMEGD